MKRGEAGSNEIKQANSTSFENSNLISISKDTLLNKITLPSLLYVPHCNTYISQILSYSVSLYNTALPKLNHASPLYYPRGIRVQVPKTKWNQGSRWFNGDHARPWNLACISGIPLPSLLEIRFPSNYANKWSRTGKNVAAVVGRKETK